ncbi:hypothetical protein PV08_07294 [Exophiala spinifera]|uniref:Cytochrome P450 n=1 Tax=Exophiala spinifera TaxID=91928 RepID=A0A0D2B791_9EURO|nr:uncharacterized protein PV08_07294 [Exophiala spinifera]KIW14510.1 hypothetical protein PV08_07294 [Exophiala spinifera]
MEDPARVLFQSRPVTLAMWLMLLTAAFSLVKRAQRAYFTPLSTVPGPWFAKFSSAILILHSLRGQRVQYIHALHQSYGPVVRIGPEEVDVADLQGYHTIHKIGNGFQKSQWYPRFRTAYEHQDVFSETDPKNHGIRRKMLSRPFSKSNLTQNWAALVNERAQVAVQKIKGKAEAGICNVFEWWHYMAIDIIGKVSFGESFGMLELGQKTEFIQTLEKFTVIAILRSEFPALYKIICLIPNFIYDINWGEKLIVRQGTQILTRAKEGSLDRTNIFTGHIVADETGESGISADSMVVEATGLIGAGGGTASVTLTYLVWAVLQNPRIQKRLEDEVAALPDDFNDSDLEELRFMNAVLEETLRLYGPIPGALQRVTPKEGLHLSGHFIPAGTTVCTQSFSMHRIPQIFSNPESFEPDRFLQDKYTSPEQKSAFAAFGAGARVCLGIHLAYMEMRRATALFFRECAGARLALNARDDMDMVNFFGGAPKGQSCNITIRKSDSQ